MLFLSFFSPMATAEDGSMEGEEAGLPRAASGFRNKKKSSLNVGHGDAIHDPHPCQPMLAMPT